jgi:hypothetical protein
MTLTMPSNRYRDTYIGPVLEAAKLLNSLI